MLEIRAHNLEQLVEDIKKIIEYLSFSLPPKEIEKRIIRSWKANVYEYYEEDAYGEEFYKNAAEILFRKLPKNPRVKIIKGFDDLCKKCQLRKGKSQWECLATQRDDEYSRILGYGFEIGKCYFVKEILSSVGIEKSDIEKYFNLIKNENCSLKED